MGVISVTGDIFDYVKKCKLVIRSYNVTKSQFLRVRC